MLFYIGLFLKGIAMGAANVIPGVSGGTIAFITGIYERLINAIKSLNVKALNLLIKGKFKELIEHVDLSFLLPLFVGIAVSIISLAKIFEFLFDTYPVLIWAYFFGLILASVFFIGKRISVWNVGTLFAGFLFAGIAAAISFLTPAVENENMFYVFICGIVAICSMILPGLSGSFILILMGNYLLVLRAIPAMDFKILIPLGVGCVAGLIAFSHFLSWLFDNYRAHTISAMTGFILGSLATIWPWKKVVYLTDAMGEIILRKGEPKVAGYEWKAPELLGGAMPENFSGETWTALFLVVVGIVSIWLMERFSEPIEA